MSTATRVGAGGLLVSLGLAVGVATHEGWIGKARPPVPGDVETAGFGSTTNEQGRPFRAGEQVDPVRGLVLLGRDLEAHARIVKSCVDVPLAQNEFEAYVSLAYNIGPGHKGKDGFCLNKEGKTAVIPRRLAAGDYRGACEAILMYANFQGRRLPGLVKRREAEYRLCMGGGDASA